MDNNFHEPMTDETDFDNWYGQVCDRALDPVLTESRLGVDDARKAIADEATNLWRPGLSPYQWLHAVIARFA